MNEAYETSPDWLLPSSDHNWLRTGFVTAEDHKRLVCISLVQSFKDFGILRTGYGYSLKHLRPKDWTGLSNTNQNSFGTALVEHNITPMMLRIFTSIKRGGKGRKERSGS